MASEYSFFIVSLRFYTQSIRSHRFASFRVLSRLVNFGKSAIRTMRDNNTRTNVYRRLNKRIEFNQIINDFSIFREILTCSKFQHEFKQLRLLVQKVYGTKNEGHLWFTINYHSKRIFKKCHSSVIARLTCISGNSLVWGDLKLKGNENDKMGVDVVNIINNI